MSVSSELCDKFRLELAQRFEPYGWKYLKSKQVLKKQVNDIEMHVYLGTSWHNSSESVRIRMWFMSWCKSISTKHCQDSNVMGFRFSPSHGENWEWWQLATPEEYEYAVKDTSELFEKAILPLVEKFKNDYKGTVYDIAMNGYSDPCFHSSPLKKNTAFCYIQFASHVLGKKIGQQVAIKHYEMMSEERQAGMCREIQKYLENMEKAKVWRSNGSYFVSSDVMYLVDNGMVGLGDNGLIIFPSVE